MRVALAACLGAAALLAGGVDEACACSCVALDARQALDRYEGAFIGRLVEKREPSKGKIWSSADPAVYVFDVEQVAKGELTRTLNVSSPVSGASCGIEAPPGERIGLFVERDGDEWRSYLCLQVAPAQLEQAARDAGIALRAPVPAETETGSSGTNTAPFVAAGAGALVLALGALVVWRRRAKLRSAQR